MKRGPKPKTKQTRRQQIRCPHLRGMALTKAAAIRKQEAPATARAFVEINLTEVIIAKEEAGLSWAEMAMLLWDTSRIEISGDGLKVTVSKVLKALGTTYDAICIQHDVEPKTDRSRVKRLKSNRKYMVSVEPPADLATVVGGIAEAPDFRFDEIRA